ncbi:zinc-ribbon domain-containing protein [Candidatus Bathyarchaeota archaeon]|nr:MAG: zinc-ribbon domain-containing protein [Candidatus Bathyarchaeota archaeon]
MAYCWRCGAQLYENSSYCHSCGASAKPSPTSVTGAQTGFERLKDDKEFQDQWVKRIVAYVIDVVAVSVVVYFLLLVVALPVVPTVFFGQTFPFVWFWGFWLGGIASLMVLAYFVIAEAVFERTLGKELLGLKVTRLDGKRVDLWSSFVRNVSKVSFVLLVIDLAAGLGTHGDGRQKYSDRYIGTTVETTNTSRIIPDRI